MYSDMSLPYTELYSQFTTKFPIGLEQAPILPISDLTLSLPDDAGRAFK